jgi:hypothetical protein
VANGGEVILGAKELWEWTTVLAWGSLLGAERHCLSTHKLCRRPLSFALSCSREPVGREAWGRSLADWWLVMPTESGGKAEVSFMLTDSDDKTMWLTLPSKETCV